MEMEMEMEMEKTTSNLPAALAGIAQAIVADAATTPSRAGGDQFMKFSKGEWIYGVDATEVQEGSQWLINSGSLSRGYQCWGLTGTPDASKLLGEDVRVLGSPVDPNTLPVLSAPWKAAVALQLKCLTGEDVGIQASWQACTKGGTDAFNEQIIPAVSGRIVAGSAFCYPVVELESDGYAHPDKSIGFVKTPVFKVVDWADAEGVREGAEPAVKAVEEKQAAEPAAEPAAEERPRRRKRAKVA